MKVKLIPETTYRVETLKGTPLGTFTKESEWQGMTKLRQAGKGSSLIFHNPGSDLLLLVFDKVSAEVVEVVKGSPDLLHQISKDDE